MYTIHINNNLLFDPRLDETALSAPSMTLEDNKFGTLAFTIYPNHPQYDNIDKLTDVLSVYRDGTLYKQFRPVYTKRSFKGGVQYKCESILARLNDFLFRPFDYTGSLSGLVDEVLASYNERAASDKQILRGNITVTDNNDYVHYSSVDYLPHWEVLQTRLVDTHGGFFMERYADGSVYLDYLREEDLPDASQVIRFGTNMTDLFIETDSEETFSVLVPTGADVESFDPETGDPTTERLTIRTVNDGKDYIENAAAIAIYGRRETTKRWEDVTLPENLLTKGREYLDSIAVKFKQTISLSAIDLHNVDVSTPSFGWMRRVRVESKVHSLAETYILRKITIPLGDPSGMSITLGETRLTLTDRISDVSPATVQAIQNVIDSTGLSFEEIRQTITANMETMQTTLGQTESSILARVVAEYVGKSEFVNYQNTVSTSLTMTQNDITAVATDVRTYVDNSTAEMRTYINNVQTYIRYSTAGLELGAVGSDFKTIITNTKISFMQGATEIAYISNNKLYISEAQVTSQMLYGVGSGELFGWVFTDTGYGLKWVGEQA